MCFKRFIVGFDVHGDMQDKDAVSMFLKFCDIWKPSYRIMGGDVFDFRPLRKKASEDERRESMVKDFNDGMGFIKKFQPTHFLRGNHDERMWKLAESKNGPMSDLAIFGINRITEDLFKMKCSMLPYHKRDGVLRLGHLKIIHGFKCGQTAARRTALTYGSILMGHGHAVQMASIDGLEQRTGMMCGCLCNLNMEYNATQMESLVQEHGFAYGIINEKTGSYNVWQARKIDGRWILPTDYVTL